jgi:tetratricopeptide (TPR) repeat protein
MTPRAFALWAVFALSVLRADDYAELFRQAADDTARGQYADAIAKYKAALTIRPAAAEALNNLAVVYYQAHEFTEALETATKVWPAHKELKSSALIAGLAAVQCNRPREALSPLQALLSIDGNNRDALLGLASAHVALDELPQAIDIYRRETTLSPRDASAWYGLAICYERLAEKASRKLSLMQDQSSYSKRLLAEYLQSAGDTKLAAEAFGDAEASKAEPSLEAEQTYRSARELAGKSRDAFSHFVDLAPDSWQSALFQGDVERQHGNLSAALAHYQRAAAAQPDNAAALLGQGTVYWEMGQFDLAAACLHRTLELNPHATQAIFELANIAVRRHEDKAAIPLLEQYLAAQPNAFAARADLGRAYSHLGQYEKAADELGKAAASDEHGDVQYQLAVALRKLGRTREADAALKRSAELREAQLRREQKLKANP